MMKIKNILFLMKFLKKILNNVTGDSIEYIKEQLDLLDENLLDYVTYWNEKYYRNGFCKWSTVG